MYTWMFRRYRTNTLADGGSISDKPVLGAELIPDASRWFNIDNDPYWTKRTFTISNGVLNATNVTEYFGNRPLKAGAYHQIEFEIKTISSGVFGVSNVTTTGGRYVNTIGKHSFIVLTSGYFWLQGNNFTGTIDNISVREVLINSVTTDYLKMSQNNRIDKSIRFGWLGEAGSKIESGKVSKAYSLYPNYQVSRRNLLTYTEEFDNAAWGKDSATTAIPTITSNQASFNRMTADLLDANSAAYPRIAHSAALVNGITYTLSLHTKKVQGDIIALRFLQSNSFRVDFNLTTKTAAVQQGAGSYTITELTNGWFYISITGVVNSISQIQIIPGVYDGSQRTDKFYIWGAQLEVGSVATDYQRVQEATNWEGSLKDATQPTPNSRPYLTGNIAPNEKLGLKNPNGGSNFMTHPTISFAANDSWSVTTVLNTDLLGRSNNSEICSIYGLLGSSNNSISFLGVDNTIGIGTNSIPNYIKSKRKYGKCQILTIVKTPNNVYAYIDAVLIGSNVMDNSISINTLMGVDRGGGNSQMFQGQIKSHIIRSQALTQQQVTAEYNYLRSVYPEIESVVIGTQEWATSNCAVAASSNGTVIPDGTLTANWIAGTSYWCHHTNIDNGAIYDKLYNKAAKLVLAANPPEGWHYATQAELTTIAALGGNALKLIGNTYWTTANGTNATGLSLLGSGKRNADGGFNTIKTECYIWAADTDFVLKVTDAGVATIEAANANDGYALRLVKNA